MQYDILSLVIDRMYFQYEIHLQEFRFFQTMSILFLKKYLFFFFFQICSCFIKGIADLISWSPTFCFRQWNCQKLLKNRLMKYNRLSPIIRICILDSIMVPEVWENFSNSSQRFGLSISTLCLSPCDATSTDDHFIAKGTFGQPFIHTI